MQRKISLVTMGAGNVISLKKTLDSFKDVVDEFIYGDMLVFPEDMKTVRDYQKEYNIRIIKMPFNYIFQMGFASCLNFLASHAKNDMVMYMNTSEAIDEDYGINEIIDNNPDNNTFFFIHKTDPHRWHRCYDRTQLQWSGVIHEELVPMKGEMNPYHKPIFMMKDYEKDMDDPFKAAVFNSQKEAVYFNNYLKLVDQPKTCGATNEGWVRFAEQEYNGMVERLLKKGDHYEALKRGEFEMLWNYIQTSDYFEKERFESSDIINFQGNRKIVL